MSEQHTSQTTPTASIVAGASQSVELTDARGRKITVRRLGVLDQARMLKAIGGEQSGNEAFVRIATAACMVSHVDGVLFPMPRTEAEVEAAIGRMGDEGYLSVIIQHAKWTRAANAVIEEAMKSFEADVKN